MRRLEMFMLGPARMVFLAPPVYFSLCVCVCVLCTQGAWYCEVKVAHLGETGHVRLGWCTRKAELQAPVGFDTHGYCYRWERRALERLYHHP